MFTYFIVLSNSLLPSSQTTLPSRYKIVTATRPHEDADGFLDSKNDTNTPGQRVRIKFDDIPK